MKSSIRDLFLVTLIAAVCVAWWVDKARWSADRAILDMRLDEWHIEHMEGEIRIQRSAVKELRELLLKSQAPAPNPPKP
jgi:hypothetical protein